jgi:hypothetical protein
VPGRQPTDPVRQRTITCAGSCVICPLHRNASCQRMRHVSMRGAPDTRRPALLTCGFRNSGSRSPAPAPSHAKCREFASFVRTKRDQKAMGGQNRSLFAGRRHDGCVPRVTISERQFCPGLASAWTKGDTLIRCGNGAGTRSFRIAIFCRA